MRRQICNPLVHVWRPVRGGKREVCINCGTSFPCNQMGCDHVDCHEAGNELSAFTAAVLEGVVS